MSKPKQQPNRPVILFKDEKYNEEDFIIPAQDTKGHSERVFVRLQPGHIRDLNVIVNSKRYPFKTFGDIIRLSTKLIIDALQRLEPTLPLVNNQVDVIIQLVRDEQFNQEFNDCFERIAAVMNKYQTYGNKEQATRLLFKIKVQMDMMPYGYWKKKYLEELGNRYAEYFQGVDLLGALRTDEEILRQEEMRKVISINAAEINYEQR